MAAAAPEGTGSGATVTATTTNRFTAACGALSRYVKAAETAHVSRPLPLMPDTDVDDAAPERRDEAEDGPALAAQLTIVYGGRVLVLDDVPADKAAGLLQVAAGAVAAARRAKTTDMPVARKVSLQRFMEKRKGQIATCGEPYLRPGACADPDGELALAL